jgi:outer membrane lipoprotein-sorting protein
MRLVIDLIALFALAALPGMPDTADSLAAVFAHIDNAAKTFKGMTADVSNTHYTALVDDKDVQTGTMKLLRVKPGVTRVLSDLGAHGGGQKVALDGHNVNVYNPKTNIVDVYNLANKQGMIDQFLLLGFGATSEELKSTYSIAWVGEEQIGSQTASHLKLVPKSAETLHTLKQADLWFGVNGLVVQQKFLFPSGDYTLVTYSNMKVGAVPEKDLELKTAKGAVYQKHD